jgi:hypothetical protein
LETASRSKSQRLSSDSMGTHSYNIAAVTWFKKSL